MHEFACSTRLIGRRGLWHHRIDSTNALAALHAGDIANDGLVFVADEQTAGRGRQGRTWFCPPGCGVLMSVLIFPPERLRQAPVLTALAAVSVCETIAHFTKLEPVIKWPNDVLIRGRKVSGILVEQGQGTILGIGLNVSTPAEAFAAAELPHAGSLRLFADEPLDRESIARYLIQALDTAYVDLLTGLEGDLEARWRAHMSLLGKQVVLHTSGEYVRGRVLDLAFDGVTLENERGDPRHFRPEVIQQITAVP